ncbi:hypothetical protein COS83_01985 [archaeon CG07_land_8_20_14_0_80_38_8]|nr:MAG: hypothetical protein COS83_01985 [archaeon CG07_land_8_20_14_0_80_38_8]PIU88431.1 MAG: hypothetical protein COS64_03710 [archaeon CG06_land_8_20_14_3_00_37_11]
MALFEKKDKSEDSISFPEPPEPDMEPAFPEPPKKELDSVKQRVETPANYDDENGDLIDDEIEEPPMRKIKIPEPSMPTSANPTLYLKLTEYKNVVEATNKMRKDIEKTKSLISELRVIEKEEHNKLEKSEELVRDIDKIVALFEKTMVTPVE